MTTPTGVQGGVTEEARRDIAWALADIAARQPSYALYRNYYRGQHRLAFASAKFRNAFGDLFREFADNVCRPVVDTFVDRLQLTSFDSPDEKVAQAASDLWANNRMGSRAGEVMLNAAREADGFLMVWTDAEGDVRMWVQTPDTVAVRYSDDNPDRIDLAAKVWRKGRGWRCTLYYPDRIERYETAGTSPGGGLPQARAFRPFMPVQENDPEPVEDNPYDRVPFFHFPNGTVGTYGESMLVDAVPLQDGLNKSVADMLVAMEFHAYPQRWATGLEVRYKDDGTEIAPLDPGADRLWHVPSEGTRFGQFDPANLDGFLKVQDAFRLEVARVTGTPLHALGMMGSGQPPSGTSLKVTEGRLTKRAKDRHRDWGETWEDAVAFALRLQGMAEGIDITAVWASPETEDDKAQAETQEIKQRLGVSKRKSLAEMGYTPEEIEEMLDEAEQVASDVDLALGAVGGGRPVPSLADAQTLATLPGGPPPQEV